MGFDQTVPAVPSGEAAGAHLVDAPAIGGIAFTGSYAVGMEIYRKLAAGPYARPLAVEMGGKNPAYVTASADLDVAADGVMRSAFGLQGEKCSACSVAYVETPVLVESPLIGLPPLTGSKFLVRETVHLDPRKKGVSALPSGGVRSNPALPR